KKCIPIKETSLKKNSVRSLIATALAPAFALAFSAPAMAADITLRAITYAPPSKYEDSMAVFKSWIEKVKEKSGGKIEIKIIGGPEVFAVNDQVNATSKGLADV